ncbi:ATP-binding protein [Streptomyces sp. BRA346]|uniref:ATP-binding protein n=1 Tax=Streptomyces sp. BRA346 TaxID=2878199 RepID=UPI004063131C
MSLPLTRRIARAALLVAASATPVVGAADAASAVDPALPHTPKLGGLSSLDPSSVGELADSASQQAGRTVKAILPAKAAPAQTAPAKSAPAEKAAPAKSTPAKSKGKGGAHAKGKGALHAKGKGKAAGMSKGLAKGKGAHAKGAPVRPAPAPLPAPAAAPAPAPAPQQAAPSTPQQADELPVKGLPSMNGLPLLG